MTDEFDCTLATTDLPAWTMAIIDVLSCNMAATELPFCMVLEDTSIPHHFKTSEKGL